MSFIVPTLGRPTLEKTLRSIVDQTDPYWQALVIADCVEGFALPVRDDRIYSVNLSRKHGESNFSGEVRNHGLTNACGAWIGFVDDDDRLDENYVKWLREESDGNDLVVFRMIYEPGGGCLPPGKEIHCGQIGISFAVRNDFRRSKDLWFFNGPCEDWVFLDTAFHRGGKIHMSERVAYYVRH